MTYRISFSMPSLSLRTREVGRLTLAGGIHRAHLGLKCQLRPVHAVVDARPLVIAVGVHLQCPPPTRVPLRCEGCGSFELNPPADDTDCLFCGGEMIDLVSSKIRMEQQ